MAKVETKHARVHPLTKQRLTELKTALERDEGQTLSEDDIIGALVYGNTVAQIVTLLPVYKRYTANHYVRDALYSTTTRTVRSRRSLAPRIDPPSSSVPRM